MLYPVTGWLLNPVLAGAAMGLSSVFVLTNSLRLKRVSVDAPPTKAHQGAGPEGAETKLTLQPAFNRPERG